MLVSKVLKSCLCFFSWVILVWLCSKVNVVFCGFLGMLVRLFMDCCFVCGMGLIVNLV